MDSTRLKDLIEAGIPGAEARVQLQGNKSELVVISDAFAGKRPVQKQQMVYQCLNDLIASGELHAVSMQTYTREEWSQKQKFGFA
jgi:acid stress-induced BolA-like protein IbaG/YrbA